MRHNISIERKMLRTHHSTSIIITTIDTCTSLEKMIITHCQDLINLFFDTFYANPNQSSGIVLCISLRCTSHMDGGRIAALMQSILSKSFSQRATHVICGHHAQSVAHANRIEKCIQPQHESTRIASMKKKMPDNVSQILRSACYHRIN